MYSSVRDSCPACGYPSYANGYCHKCGLYRPPDKEEWRDERKVDLVDMMNSDEAIEYGFELTNEEDKEDCDERD